MKIDEEKRKYEVNLLNSCKIKPKWIPRFLSGQYSWKIFSGKWKLESPNKLKYFHNPGVRFGENISIAGSGEWNDFALQAKFKFLNESSRPPEGGAILYFLFRNIKNHYSLHFCLSKKRIEFVKRYKGNWSILESKSYDLETQREYFTTIITKSGFHYCQMDGGDLIICGDRDISKGCVGIGTKYCDTEFNSISISLRADHS